MTKLDELANLGQSVWLDYIRRSFIENGELQKLISEGIRGLTSNPTIFEKAIAGSADYDIAMYDLVKDEKSVDEIYESLVLEDIKDAADLLLPVYKETNGLDGYVSIEVNPTFARDRKNTIDEAKRLFITLNHPNIMIKVPATQEGVEAIEQLISEGINVNATLMFSLEHYRSVANAYINGLEQLREKGGDVSRIASVASFFISRVDTSVDRALDEIKNGELKGKIAIANAKMVYQEFEKLFGGSRWEKLAQSGAKVQRVLWASTGTKNPQYPDTLYVDELIGKYTVNTLPPATLSAFLDHGNIAPTLIMKLDEAEKQLNTLKELGINLDSVTEKLQHEGIDAFSHSFEKLMDTIKSKREQLLADRNDFKNIFK